MDMHLKNSVWENKFVYFVMSSIRTENSYLEVPTDQLDPSAAELAAGRRRKGKFGLAAE